MSNLIEEDSSFDIQRQARDEKLREEGVTAELREAVWDPRYGVVWGACYGDVRRRFGQGAWIHTSMVDLAYEGLEDYVFVKTLNSLYKVKFKDKKNKMDCLKFKGTESEIK